MLPAEVSRSGDITAQKCRVLCRQSKNDPKGESQAICTPYRNGEEFRSHDERNSSVEPSTFALRPPLRPLHSKYEYMPIIDKRHYLHTGCFQVRKEVIDLIDPPFAHLTEWLTFVSLASAILLATSPHIVHAPIALSFCEVALIAGCVVFALFLVAIVVLANGKEVYTSDDSVLTWR